MKANAVEQAQSHRGTRSAGLWGRPQARHHGRGHWHFINETPDERSTLTRSPEISNQ